MREGGSLAVGDIDYYEISLAFNPDCGDGECTPANMYAAGSRKVYVTVSAARSPQEEADGFNNPAPLADGEGDTVWLCLGNGTAGECSTPSQFQRHKVVNGVLVDENGRALVLTFDSSNWQTKQRVYLLGGRRARRHRDRSASPRARSASRDPAQRDLEQPLFDGALRRNVEATIYDNDTPGVFVTQIERLRSARSDLHRGRAHRRRRGLLDPAVGGLYTGTDDDLLIQLAMAPARPGRGRAARWTLPASGDPAQARRRDSRWAQHADGNGGT